MRELLDDLAAGGSPRLAIGGEPGIGKTALVSELCRVAHERGFRVASGSGTEFERDLPFALVSDALDELAATSTPAVLDALGPKRSAHLAAVLPSLAARHAESIPLPAERYLLHDAASHLLGVLATTAPLLVTLDDVQWADCPSFELIAHLLRRPPRGPVALVLAHRPHEAPRPMRDALAVARRNGALTVLSPGPLREREADELLGAHVDAADRRALYRESGGNPFFLVELARAAGASPLPESVSAAIAGELARLSPAALQLAHAGAISGEPFDLDLAAAVAQLGESEALDAIDELMAADLVRRSPVPRRFRFRHPIVRRAVYESCGEGVRLVAHRRAADVLAARGASLSERAHHVERSARAGDEAAVDVLFAAGQADAVRAPAVAARWFGAALRLVPIADAERRLGLLVPLAAALSSAGQIKESRTVLREAHELVPPEQEVLRARILGLAATVEHMLGNPAEARALIAGPLAELSRSRSASACALRLELSVHAWFSGDWDAMVTWGRRARGDAMSLGERTLEAEAGALLALGESCRGRARACDAALGRAALTFESLSAGELAFCLRGLSLLGLATLDMERFVEADAMCLRGLESSRETGQDYWFVPFLCQLAWGDIERGLLASAAARAEAATEAATVLGNDQLRMWALAVRCWVAQPWLPECFLGAALIEAGQPEQGRAAILRGGGGDGLGAVELSFRSYWYAALSAAELARGCVQAADAWLRLSEPVVKRFPLPGQIARQKRAEAAALLARGERERATALSDQATRLFRGQGQRVEAARARLLSGRGLRAAGRREDALAALVEAREELAACGDHGYLRRTEAELEQLRRGEPDAPLARLSSREREVADLVASGKANKEIAADLVLSVKTVERHLTRVFSKLDITSRAALAAAVERERATN
jgi:DNA-binding CsgD family transcriptional regulator